jgi:threonine/homoserine/homoserine lactone efflux protein
MHSAPALAMIILGATITPGPNNFAILHLAATRGPRAAWPAIMAIVMGGLVLYALVAGGFELWIHHHAWLEQLLLWSGAAWLAFMGVSLIRGSFRSAAGTDAVTVPAGPLGLFVFQLVNPKGWLLMVSVAAAAHCAGSGSRIDAALPPVLLTVVPAASLLVWLYAGTGLRCSFALDLRSPAMLRLAGLVLVICAVCLMKV